MIRASIWDIDHTRGQAETTPWVRRAQCAGRRHCRDARSGGSWTGEAIANYLRQFSDAFPDIRYEHLGKHEAGNVAIDEGYITGTHTVAATAYRNDVPLQRLAVKQLHHGTCACAFTLQKSRFNCARKAQRGTVIRQVGDNPRYSTYLLASVCS
jgi:hypothetical protein